MGRGRTFVDLVTGIERSMCSVAHTLPAVDHLGAAPAPPDAASWQALEDDLARLHHDDVVGALREWRRHDETFRAAVAHLGELQAQAGGEEYQHALQQRIDDVRAERAQLRRAADELADRIVAALDAAG